MDNLNLTDFVSISNHIHRRLGRQIGLWAWQGFETACSFVLPWLVAGELSPAHSVEATLAAAQQRIKQLDEQLDRIMRAGVQAPQQQPQQNPGPVGAPEQPQPIQPIQVVANQPARSFRDLYWDAINYGIASGISLLRNSPRYIWQTLKFSLYTAPAGIMGGAYLAIRWVDGTISNMLGTIDGALNRHFKGIPGYRLLTWYPLRLGNWEHTYKQARNYALFVNPLWQRFVQPFLAKHVFFADMTKAVSSYAAPYAELAVRAADKAVIGFLSTVSGSAADYGLESFAKSFSGWWNSKSISMQLFHSSVTLSDSFIPVRLTTVEIEAAAERHIAFLASSGTQAIEKLGALNAYIHGYADPIMTLMSTMANDVYRYGSCVVNTDKGFMPCTQSGFNHAYTDYAVPALSYLHANALAPLGNLGSRYALNPIMQFLQRNCVTGPMFYFGDCVVNGNSGYLMQTGSMLKQATTVSLSANTCPVDTMIVSGMKNCSSNAMQYMYVDYAQPSMGASWNFICNSASTITNGIYNGVGAVLTGARDGIYDGVTGLATLAAANPGTTVAIGVAIPTVLFAAYGASVAYERVMRPNAQHHVHHNIQPVVNL